MEAIMKKKGLIVLMIVAVTAVFSLPYLQAGSQAYGLTSAEKKLVKAAKKGAKKKKNGVFKAKGKWFVAKNKKVAKGFPMVNKNGKKKAPKKYFWTDNLGVLKSGVVTRYGHTYKYNGKSGAVVNKALTVKGRKLWFSGTGRGNPSVGNTTANKAVGLVMDNVSLQGKTTPEAKMRACYNYVYKKFGTGAIKPSPDTSSASWIPTYAFDSASKKRGTCFNKGALIFELAKCCGMLEPALATGTSNLGSGEVKEDNKHCWVMVNSSEGVKFLDVVFEKASSSAPQFFLVTPEQKDRAEDGCDYEVNVGNKTYKYIQDKVFQ